MANATMTALVWPAGLERTVTPISGRSRTRLGAAVADVLRAINLLGEVTSLPTSELVVSFDQNARRGQAVDGAAAVWFLWGDAQRCVACDLYGNSRENLFAIAQLVRGFVAEYDRGSTAAVRHALESHMPRVAPPPPPPPPPPSPADRLAYSSSSDWSILLGVSYDSSASVITAAFRRLAHEKHPDKGGHRQDWDQLMSAYQQARRALTARQIIPDKWEIAELADEEAFWSSLFSAGDVDEPLKDH